MKIIFMGTPDFAVPSLQKLIACDYQVCAVFTQPDKPKGRGHRLQPSPVKEIALKYGIPIFQPDTLRALDIQHEIAAMNADVIVVVAYGKMMPKAVLDMPKRGCINVHGSLLPRYRGAAPIQWAVINGERVTGVTTMFMAEGMDSGDMLLHAPTAIEPEETSGELYNRLKLMGAELLVTTLEELQRGGLKRIPQNERDATYAPMLKKEHSIIDWHRPAQWVHDQIRGLNPWPYAIVQHNGKRLKLLGSRIKDGGGVPGGLSCIDGELFVACGKGQLCITELQTENGKRMSGHDYLLGHPLKDGDCFE